MIRRMGLPNSAAYRTSGFTLVELLVTVTIISILAGIAIAALASAREIARINATRATVEKITDIIMQRYESYRTRRLPVTQGYIQQFAAAMTTTYGSVPSQELTNRIRLDALRDLMRMEMPDRWSDVVYDPSNPVYDVNDTATNHWRPNLVLPPEDTPSLTIQYFQKYKAAYQYVETKFSSLSTDERRLKLQGLASAECLYMIVMSDPEAAAQFNAFEIGDTDEDSLPEFIDGWGHPISFLRWPAGFVASFKADTDIQVDSSKSKHDPFDPQNVDRPATTDPDSATGYALYPLIYSAGPDGFPDIYDGTAIASGETLAHKYSYNCPLDPYNNPGIPSPPNNYPGTYKMGQPMHLEGASVPSATPLVNLRHYDNIHNHRIEGR